MRFSKVREHSLVTIAGLIVAGGCGGGGGGGGGGSTAIQPIARLSEPAPASTVAPIIAAGTAAVTTWTATSGLRCGEGAANFHQFGNTLASGDLDGDGRADLVVGVPYAEVGTANSAGRIVAFMNSGTLRCDNSGILNSPTPGFRRYYGRGLLVADVTGDGMAELIVGEPADSSEPGVNVYRSLGGGTLSSPLIIPPPVPGFSTRFGEAPAVGELSGDSLPDLVVGAPGENFGAGAVYIYPADGAGSFLAPRRIEAPTPAREALFGATIAVDDVTGDGRPDLVVGAPGLDPAPTSVGTVFVFAADGAGGFAQAVALAHPAPRIGALFGAALAIGDVTGDGLKDVAVSAYRLDSGEVLVFRSTGGGTFASPTLVATPEPQSNAKFGFSVAIGNVAGDGRLELVVGATGVNVATAGVIVGPAGVIGNTAFNAGKVYVFGFDAQGGPVHTHTLLRPNPLSNDQFGESLLLAELTGTGAAEIVIGADGATVNGYQAAGDVHIFSLGD